MTGSNQFNLKIINFFERSLKDIKSNKLKEELKKYLSELINNPYHKNSRQEPLPKSLLIDNWTFHKLSFKIGKGASGQIRLMYLVNQKDQIVLLLWIYNHEKYPKRPEDNNIKKVILEALKES